MRGTPQNIICILTYADDIPPSICSIIRCDQPQIGNGKKNVSTVKICFAVLYLGKIPLMTCLCINQI